MTRSQIEMQIAGRAYEAELVNAKAVGHCPIESPMMAFGAFCGVLLIANSPEKDWVWPRGSEPREV